MFRAFWFLSTVSVLITCVFQCSFAQLSQNYKSLAVSGGRDLKLIGALRDQLGDELKRIEKKERTPYVITRYNHNTQSLVKLVKARRVVKNDTLQRVVDQTFDSLLHNTHLRSKPRRVLIVKLPYGNAMCMGEGTFLITTGLLGRITNEAQLAFTLAHEIAHYELNHVRDRVLKAAKMEYEKKARQAMVKIFRPTNVVGLNELDSLRKLVYTMSRFSRENEREADSVGLVLMRNAGYQPQESISLLSVLDSIDYTKERLGYKLFVEFDFAKYPFQDYWLRDRPSVYSKMSADYFLFSRDSIQSHPEIVQRQNLVDSTIDRAGACH
ncbi:M48 family metallopeptidase [Chryseolinea lacunae]|uniref:M48 family metallopeptidase n=1 Tax=Chryseolinea lacunae TaxID=2801331 RepID=A0ABS1KW11_9BACT|nr:M48 family metallopeptidase [Chryseolinea lacunae]MBL0743635.1 M48 family metallopeptidase [Chryseolinea lacunae]